MKSAIVNEIKLILYKRLKRLITFNGLKIAVLGLTYKPGTDDLRGAPFIRECSFAPRTGKSVCI